MNNPYKCLITGMTGMVGSHLADYILIILIGRFMECVGEVQ